MALFHPNTSAFAWTPGTYDITGSFTDPSAGSATVNRQIRPAFNNITPAASGAALGADKLVAPLGALCKIWAQPQGGAAAAAGSDNLPRGVVTGAPATGLYLLDLSGHAADITYAEASLVPAPTSPGVLNAASIAHEAEVVGIDNVNKLVYIQVVTYSAGAAAYASAGEQICFVVQMKEAGIAV